MKYLRVRNFEKFQHYSDRNPPWIKFYTWVLDDEDIEALPEATQAHLFKLWLLAARKGNVIPYDDAWISAKIGAKSPLLLNLLISRRYCEVCSGDDMVLAPDASTPTTTLASTRREEKSREEAEKNTADAVFDAQSIEAVYQAYPRHVGKQAATKKIVAALHAIQKRGESNPVEWLLAKVALFARSPKGTGDYCPHPATWFNQGRYDDDPKEWDRQGSGDKTAATLAAIDEVNL